MSSTKFTTVMLQFVPASFVVGAGMELFMLNTVSAQTWTTLSARWLLSLPLVPPAVCTHTHCVCIHRRIQQQHQLVSSPARSLSIVKEANDATINLVCSRAAPQLCATLPNHSLVDDVLGHGHNTTTSVLLVPPPLHLLTVH